MINRAIIFFIFSCSIYSIANAQSYDIESLDGVKVKIELSHELGSGILAISYLKDTLFINEYINIGEVHVLKNKFLQVSYEVRIGSDQNLSRLMLLCVNKSKVYQAMHVESFLNYDIDKVWDKKADSLKLFHEQKLYELKLDLLSDDSGTFKLNIDFHNESKSKQHPKTDHNYTKQVTLNFDASLNIFYSDYADISEYLRVYDPKTAKLSRQYIMGRFPVIKLDTTNYYYIKNDWYERGNKDYLLKYSYK